ncbi:MAG: beta-lactamase class D [Lentimonas sp.]|jgi:beta-lactamase class D
MMKTLGFIFTLMILLGCGNNKNLPNTYTRADEQVKFMRIDLSDSYEFNNLGGQTLIYDEKYNQYYSNDFKIAKEKFIPASTFKIVNTLIGLESGTIKSDFVFNYNGEKRRNAAWEKSMNIREAFQTSCVPCYQDLAERIGLNNMTNQIKSMNYPGANVNEDNLTNFWLNGDATISPLEQIDYLRRLMTKQMVVSSQNIDLLKNAMAIDSTSKGKMYAKTGWAQTDEMDHGWYVGFIEQEKNRIYFATLIEPKEGYDMTKFANERKSITTSVLTNLGYWE